MQAILRTAALGILVLMVSACGDKGPQVTRAMTYQPAVAGNTPEMQRLVAKYADIYDVPESLIHRVIRRESMYNPAARNGAYYGLMQIDPRTARSMGFQGPNSGLLDAETNLKYAGKYLRGAWLVSNGDESQAVGWYARGYYYQAKAMGLLQKAGLSG